MKKAKNHNRPWTSAQVKKMRRYAASRTSARVTAAILGRSPGATRFKACMLGIHFRSINRRR